MLTMISLKDWMNRNTPEKRIELADSCGTTLGYLYQLSGGHRRPSLRLALNIQKFTNGEVSVESFSDHSEAA